MWRASIHYGRKGLALHAMSAIDLALWDLYGKAVNEPVYNLMVAEPSNVFLSTQRHRALTWPKSWGFMEPRYRFLWTSAGHAGMKSNVAFVGNWRKKVGPDFPLMLDCYMALDVEYTADLAHRLNPST